MRTLKKLVFVILYLGYLLTFAALVVYAFFYRPHIRELRKLKRGTMSASSNPHKTQLPMVRHVDSATMRLLGKARGNKKSTFSNFAQKKRQGVFRVCCLGDSFTAGDEVDDGFDYPSILQQLFEESDFTDVEVINFGVGGYGLGQTYIMWDRVARNFACDAYLLGPRGFQSLRDTTFGHILKWSPYYLHARYVLQDGDVKVIEVPGDTYGERFDHHFQFVTPWRYLRYNRNPPAPLEALMPQGKTIRNPFYYERRGIDEEAHDIYEILLAKMAQEGKTPIIAGPHRDAILRVADHVKKGNLSASRFHDRLTVPYLAKYSHAAAMGNQLVAMQFFHQLTGEVDPLWVLNTSDIKWTPDNQSAKGTKHKIENLSRLDLEIGDTSVARLVVQNTSFSVLKIDSLLSLSGAEETMVDGCFAPLDFELHAGMEVVMRTGQVEHHLGQVSLVGGGLNMGVIKVDGFHFWKFRDFERLDQLGQPTPLTEGQERPRGLFFQGNNKIGIEGLDQATVLVDGRPALEAGRGEIDGRAGLWFKPVTGPCRLFRGLRAGVLNLDALASSGTIRLIAEHWRDGVSKRQVGTWRKTAVRLPPPRNPPYIAWARPRG